jgi:hypothetical protein
MRSNFFNLASRARAAASLEEEEGEDDDDDGAEVERLYDAFADILRKLFEYKK